VYTSPLMKASD